MNRDIELTSYIRIGVVTTGIDETDTNGVLLGWNKKVKIYYRMEKDTLLISANTHVVISQLAVVIVSIFAYCRNLLRPCINFKGFD